MRIINKPEEILGTDLHYSPIYIDDVDEYLGKMFAYHNNWIEKVSLTTDKGNKRLKLRIEENKTTAQLGQVTVVLDKDFWQMFDKIQMAKPKSKSKSKSK